MGNQRGRSPVMLELNQKPLIFLPCACRGEQVTALFDLAGNILSHHERLLDTADAKSSGGDRDSYDWLLTNTGIDRHHVLCCGLASPGLINVQSGVIERSSNLQWQQIPLGTMLSKRLYGMPVLLENISNAAALAEKEYGSGRGYNDLIYLNLSVGIGAGIIIDGKVYGGAKGYAGEIGHMTLIPDGDAPVGAPVA